MFVHLSEHRAEAERIVLLPGAVPAAQSQAVGARIGPEPGGENPLPIEAAKRHRPAIPAVAPGQHGHLLHAGTEDPQHPGPLAQAVGTEVGEGIVVLPAGKGGALGGVDEGPGHGLVRMPE